MIKDVFPTFGKIGRTTATAPSAGVLYNDANIVYNSGTVLYGGVDNTTDLGPQYNAIELEVLPNLSVIEDTLPQF